MKAVKEKAEDAYREFKETHQRAVGSKSLLGRLGGLRAPTIKDAVKLQVASGQKSEKRWTFDQLNNGDLQLTTATTLWRGKPTRMTCSTGSRTRIRATSPRTKRLN